jgi:hypothetical protein
MEEINYLYGYPELSKEGQERTQVIINKFAEQLKELMDNTVSDFTQNLALEIVDDDSWVDIRQKTLEALCGYSESERRNKAGGTYLGQWWTQIRSKILSENRDAIITDIILDKEKEIGDLKQQIYYLQERNNHCF